MMTDTDLTIHVLVTKQDQAPELDRMVTNRIATLTEAESGAVSILATDVPGEQEAHVPLDEQTFSYDHVYDDALLRGLVDLIADTEAHSLVIGCENEAQKERVLTMIRFIRTDRFDAYMQEIDEAE